LGNPLTVRWDGRAWKRVSAPGGDHLTSPEGGYLNDVAAVSADDAWAVGAGMFNRALIEHWDGAAWTRVPSPALGRAGSLHAVAATSPGNAWAVGGTVCPGRGLVTVTEHWNGRTWTLVPTPAAGILTGVATASAASAWAVGFWTASGNAVIEHWDGTAWTSPAGFCSTSSAAACLPAGSSSPAAAITQPATSHTLPPPNTDQP
jgi:hypothetical protein